jgi:hypothetical protein
MDHKPENQTDRQRSRAISAAQAQSSHQSLPRFDVSRLNPHGLLRSGNCLVEIVEQQMAEALISNGKRAVMRVEAENRFEMRQGLRWAACKFQDAGKEMPCQGRTRIERNGALYAIQRGQEIAPGPHSAQPMRKPLAVIAQGGLFSRFERRLQRVATIDPAQNAFVVVTQG